MRNIFTFLFIISFSIQSFGQVPHMMKYQAVVRENDGTIISDQNVAFKFSVLQGSETGSAVYVEEHVGQTNSNGLISLTIGDGTSSDDFTAIAWGSDDFFLKVELDPEGSSSYQTMGVSRILSVPYAIYAHNIPDNSVNSNKLAENSVNSSKVEDGSLSGDDLAANSIDSNHIVDGSISSDDLPDEISTDKFSAYQDLTDDGRLDNNSINDVLTRGQADDRYVISSQFSAGNSSEQTFTSSGTHKVEFNEENFDVGGDYDPSNDRFVAPLNGIYHFSTGYYIQSIEDTDRIGIGFRVNGGETHWVDFHNGRGTVSGSKELYLLADDYVDVVIFCSDSDFASFESATDQYTYFSGYLEKKYTQFIIIF